MYCKFIRRSRKSNRGESPFWLDACPLLCSHLLLWVSRG